MRAQAGQIAAGVRLGVALAPDHFAVQRGPDVLLFLRLGTQLEQRGHQHGNTLPDDARRHARACKLLGQDVGFQQIRRRAVATVGFGYRAGCVAMFDQHALPGQARFALVVEIAWRRRLVGMACQERAHLIAKLFVFGSVGQVHSIPRVFGWRLTATAPATCGTQRNTCAVHFRAILGPRCVRGASPGRNSRTATLPATQAALKPATDSQPSRPHASTRRSRAPSTAT